MTIFTYKARNQQGDIVEGEIEAKNEKLAKYQVANKGLFPTEVSSQKMKFDIPILSFLKRKDQVKPRDLMAFTRQFAALFKGGVPMDRLLMALSKQTSHVGLKKAIEAIKTDVSSGANLSDAFKKYPNYFSELYTNMVHVGEMGGMLDQALHDLADILDKEYKIISRTKTALLYPKIVLSVFMAVVVLMMTFVIPRFADFYSGYGAELPVPTKIMIVLSNMFTSYWYFVATIAIAISIAYKKYVSTEKGLLKIENLRFKIPVFGNLNIMVASSRFGHLVSSLYKSGLPLYKALSIVGRAIGNKAYQKEVDDMTEEVIKGSSLANAMEGKKYFTPMLIEAVAVGEQSGSLEDMLETTSQFYDEEVTNILDQLTTLIEPLLMIGLFAMVSLLAFAVFLPMWNVTKVILPG